MNARWWVSFFDIGAGMFMGMGIVTGDWWLAVPWGACMIAASACAAKAST